MTCIYFKEMSICSHVWPASQNLIHIFLQLDSCFKKTMGNWLLLLSPPVKTDLSFWDLSSSHCERQKNRGKESHKYMAVAGINHKWRGTQRNVFVRATIKNVSSQACMRLAWHKQMHMRLQTSVNGWRSLLTWLIQLLCLNQISFSHLVLMNVKVKTTIKIRKVPENINNMGKTQRWTENKQKKFQNKEQVYLFFPIKVSFSHKRRLLLKFFFFSSNGIMVL